MDDTVELATRMLAQVAEKVVSEGDLSALTPEERTHHYLKTCESLGLNWRTRPLEYLKLNNKLVLYARKDCADQLRKIHRVDVSIVARERIDDLYVVTARGVLPDGRGDEEIGAVPIGNLKGESLANALMKATTKAKRRVTLALCGLGLLDETEIETIPGAVVGEVAGPKPSAPRARESIAPSEKPSPEKIHGLLELVQDCGIDLSTFSQHLRTRLGLHAETKINRRWLQEHLTMAQYQSEWEHYSVIYQKQRELNGAVADPDADVPDFDGAKTATEAVIEASTSDDDLLLATEPPEPSVDEDGEVATEDIQRLMARAELMGANDVLNAIMNKTPALTAAQFRDAWVVVARQRKVEA